MASAFSGWWRLPAPQATQCALSCPRGAKEGRLSGSTGTGCVPDPDNPHPPTTPQGHRRSWSHPLTQDGRPCPPDQWSPTHGLRPERLEPRLRRRLPRYTVAGHLYGNAMSGASGSKSLTWPISLTNRPPFPQTVTDPLCTPSRPPHPALSALPPPPPSCQSWGWGVVPFFKGENW